MPQLLLLQAFVYLYKLCILCTTYVSGYLRQGEGNDTLEKKNNIFFTLTVAVLSMVRSTTVLNWTIWTLMSWYIHASKHYNLIGPYIWPSADFCCRNAASTQFLTDLKPVSNVHLGGNCTTQVCVDVLRPSQPNGVMSSVVSLPSHRFTGQA